MAAQLQPSQGTSRQGLGGSVDGLCDVRGVWDGRGSELFWLVLLGGDQVETFEAEPVLSVAGSAGCVPQVCPIVRVVAGRLCSAAYQFLVAGRLVCEGRWEWEGRSTGLEIEPIVPSDPSRSSVRLPA